jgi:hypothetical protein
MKPKTDVTPQNKLVIVRGGKKSQGTMPIIISTEMHQKVKAVAADANLSLRDTVETMLLWAMDNLIIKDSDGHHV